MEQALINACKNNQLSVIKLLVAKNLNVNYRDNFGKTALTYSGLKGNLDAIKTLVQAGADSGICDDFSNSLLHHVVFSGNKEAIKYVLGLSSVDINASNMDGNTALMVAVSKFDKDAVEILLKNGAVDTANNKNLTALDLASKNGASSIVELLLMADDLAKEHKQNASANSANSQNQNQPQNTQPPQETFVPLKCTECHAYLDIKDSSPQKAKCPYCHTSFEKR